MNKIFIIKTIAIFIIGIYVVSINPANAQTSKKYGFPDVLEKVGVITDQLSPNMTEEQIKFAAKNYIGCQKIPLSLTKKLRKYNPDFVVLHYHLGIWQQQPAHQFIIDGEHWGNDWEEVNKHEDWFWHNEKGERVRSPQDGKYLMNIMNSSFQEYWKTSFFKQLKAGLYQGVFLDSSSVDLLQWEASQLDKRLLRTAAKDRKFSELNGLTWSKAYEIFMNDITSYLETKGYTTLPNINALMTTWDNTDYFTTASGAFMESAFMTQSTDDWKLAITRTLELINRDKIVIFQPYLKKDDDIATRLYYLACYFMMKGRYSYIVYFANNHLIWYPEFNIKLGKPMQKVNSLNDLKIRTNLYFRKFTEGEVYVNPKNKEEKISLNKPLWKVIPDGGGSVDVNGKWHGKLRYEKISELVLPPWSGAVLLYERP
jgi:hypothetical protein